LTPGYIINTPLKKKKGWIRERARPAFSTRETLPFEKRRRRVIRGEVKERGGGKEGPSRKKKLSGVTRRGFRCS